MTPARRWGKREPGSQSPAGSCRQIPRSDSGPAWQRRELQALNLTLPAGPGPRSGNRANAPAPRRKTLKRDQGDLSIEAGPGRSRLGPALHPRRMQRVGGHTPSWCRFGKRRMGDPPPPPSCSPGTELPSGGRSLGDGTWEQRKNEEFIEFVNIRFWQ